MSTGIKTNWLEAVERNGTTVVGTSIDELNQYYSRVSVDALHQALLDQSLIQASGGVRQVQHVFEVDWMTGTGIIPLDDTLPQNTEGTEFLSVNITPTDVANDLLVSGCLSLSSNQNGAFVQVALFRDSDVDAVAAGSIYEGDSTGMLMLSLAHREVAGTLSQITFTARAGLNIAGTTVMNGNWVERLLGGALVSSLIVVEVKP